MIDPHRIRRRLYRGLRTPGKTIVTERHATDFYVTPPPLARQLLHLFIDWIDSVSGVSTSISDDSTVTDDIVKTWDVIDVGAGTGVWGYAAVDCGVPWAIDGIDLIHSRRPEPYRDWYVADFLTWVPPHPYRIVFGNPPFYAADYLLPFADLCRADYAAFLLPLSFISSSPIRHQSFWSQGRSPHTVYILDRRPKFDVRTNTTNKYDVAWYLWDLRTPTYETVIKYLMADVGKKEDIVSFYIDPLNTHVDIGY